MSNPLAEIARDRSDMEIASALADVARGIAMRHFRKGLEVSFKSDLSPVTVADREVEAALREMLGRLVPADGILGEEMESFGLERARVWVIDPIDGTGAFATGSPLFGCLIGLLVGGRPALGVIDAPATGERWTALQGAGATLNGLPCRVSGCARLADASVSSTSIHLYAPEPLAAFQRVTARAACARLGGDCYAYGLVAAGHLDAVVETGLQPYDYLPIVPIIEEAGGHITDWSGAPLDLTSRGDVVAAASLSLHAELLEHLNHETAPTGGAINRGVRS
ncbi:MAG: inositol monophosphatase family protein [Rhodobacteraceae bacterium]|nr:inositol monophosphatase family protein [Paracoccaceae bacterium]